MEFIIGLLIGAVAGAVVTYFVIKNNKELIKSWIDKI